MSTVTSARPRRSASLRNVSRRVPSRCLSRCSSSSMLSGVLPSAQSGSWHHARVRASERGSLTSVPLWRAPTMARSRQGAVESYSSCSVSTVDTSTPGTLRRSRPMVTPAARTRKAGQQLCAAGSRATTSSRRTAPRRSWHGRTQSSHAAVYGRRRHRRYRVLRRRPPSPGCRTLMLWPTHAMRKPLLLPSACSPRISARTLCCLGPSTRSCGSGRWWRRRSVTSRLRRWRLTASPGTADAV